MRQGRAVNRDHERTDCRAAARIGAEEARLHQLGIALYRQGRFDDALAHYERALALQPDFPAALNSQGFVLQDMGRMEEALACFARALELAPDFAMARINLGMAQLKLGDWQNGWENYEARWTGSAEAESGSLQRPHCPLPQWAGIAGGEAGGDCVGRRLLVFAEQGFGDVFLFARYLPLVAKRFAKVGFVCSQPTQRLMDGSFADNIVTFTCPPSDYAGWDLQCPLLSLPRAFGTRVETIPQNLPYLRVPARAAAHWRERLDLATPGRLRVGIAWAGRRAHQYDARRSLGFAQILPLLDEPRITWVSLQKWAPGDERPPLPGSVHWLDWTAELGDFADSAALVEALDLVISIDSAMVHLAGALNRPVWMLNRYDGEWRWLNRQIDSPWYPALRIFSQPSFGDWPSVIDSVRDALATLLAQRRIEHPVSSGVPAPRAERLPASGFDIAQAMQVAGQHQSAGRLADAERILHRVLEVQPAHAHALHLLGVLAWQAGQPERAQRLITEALAADGDQALFHSNLGEMNRQQGRLDAAIRHGECAVALDPSLPQAHANLGIACYDARDYERAAACHTRALALAPRLLQSLNNLGSIERVRGNLRAAADWYRKVLAASPDHLESLSNLGAVLVENDDSEAAAVPLMRALQLRPDYPEALCNLGLVRLKQQQVEAAAALLRRALVLRPDYPEALIGLAQACRDADRLDEALRLIARATEVAPDNVEAWLQSGLLATESGDSDAAEAAYRRALQIDPQKNDALTGLGNLRLEEGRIDEAVHLFEQAIAQDHDNIGARFHLVQARKVKPGDDNLAALEALYAWQGECNDEQRISLHYALGKACDDLGEYDRAFPHFLAGARLKRGKLHYDADACAAHVQRIVDLVDAGFLERLRGAGDPSPVPIFVLGMPRSGTTLTEQIIASHPRVHGAGELRELMQVLQGPAGSGLPYPENLATVSRETLTAWGSEYVARLRRRNPQAQRITDKMPANYIALGLIPLLLPAAKIIHVRRNPVDTCVSCFTRLFNRHQEATYDLAELGRHYAAYGRLMQHWRAIMPAGSFLEVHYEDIVTDMETQARRLIDFCGLPWHDGCLDFHQTQRKVRTASVAQVRQPIYANSVERWRNYREYLGPLLAGLEEFAPPG